MRVSHCSASMRAGGCAGDKKFDTVARAFELSEHVFRKSW